jgi:hypothetical protein
VAVANGNGDSSITFASVFGTTISGNCKVTSGQGADTFEVNAATWNVTGSVTIANSHGGSTVHIDAGSGSGFDGTIGGNLTISGGDRSDDIDLYRLKVSGATTIQTGDSNDFFDFIALANSEFVGAVLINSGGGTDFISIEQLNDGSATTFKNKVTINAGSGDDHLTIGMDANDFADFDLAAVFKGGAGLDQITGVALGNPNTYPAGSPLLSEWEGIG